MSKLTVAVLAGGLSHERDISIRSGRRAVEALRHAGVRAVYHDVDAQLLPSLVADRPDVVLPLVHGATGEDGALSQILELLDLPMVGTPSGPARRAFDKPIASQILTEAGISVPPGVVLPNAAFRDLGAPVLLEAVVDHLGFPLVVHPARGGSALGMTVAHSAADLPSAMVTCFAYGEDAWLQRFIAGTEVAVSIIDTAEGLVALPPVEIVPDGGQYDYQSRYTAGSVAFYAPARVSSDVLDQLSAAALDTFRTLGLRDYGRIDAIIDADGTPWVLEANVVPGMTETSTFPLAAEAAGSNLGQVLKDLCVAAAARGAE